MFYSNCHYVCVHNEILPNARIQSLTLPHSFAIALFLKLASIVRFVILRVKPSLGTVMVTIMPSTHPECTITAGIFLGPATSTRSSIGT